jgi:hypothetical protein
MKGFNFYLGVTKNILLPYSPSPSGEGRDEVYKAICFSVISLRRLIKP